MKQTINILLILCAATLLSACIREDRSDCSNTFIRLEYLADGTESVLNEYIKDVDLYIFD